AAATEDVPAADAAAEREPRRAPSSTLRRAKPEARHLNSRATVHDDAKALSLGARGGRIVTHTELHPDDARADRDRLVDDPARGIAAPEHIDHVDLARETGGHRRETRIDALAIDRAARRKRVDRYRAIAVPLQITHDAVARAMRPRARPDDRDSFHLGENAAEVVVRIAVVVHRFTKQSPPRPERR